MSGLLSKAKQKKAAASASALESQMNTSVNRSLDSADVDLLEGSHDKDRRHSHSHSKSVDSSAGGAVVPTDGGVPAVGSDEHGPLRDDPPPLYNQRVIQADIERTRPKLGCFQHSGIKREMECILTEYCHRRKVSYKQGMNYILAPFFMAEMKDRLDIYLAFEGFIDTFLKSTFTDEEFGSLQCIFRMFRLLVQYHDPSLSLFLDQHDIMPELFASGWFMTIHAQKCDQNTLLHLWDELLLEEGRTFHYFVDLELLRFFREDVFKRSTEELPQFLVNVLVEDKDHARRLIKQAKSTYADTPPSFKQLFQHCCDDQIAVDGMLYTRLERLPCLPIEATEVVGHCYCDILLTQPDVVEHLPAASSSSKGLRSKLRRKKKKSVAAAVKSLSPRYTAKSTGKGDQGKFDFGAGAVDASGGGETNGSSGAVADGSGADDGKVDSTETNGSAGDGSGGGSGKSKKAANERRLRKLFRDSRKFADAKHLKMFVIDCRTEEQFNAGHLPCAFHLNPKMDLSSEELREKLNSLLSMKGCHFVLFFDGRDEHGAFVNNSDPILQQQEWAERKAALKEEGTNGHLGGPGGVAVASEQQLLRQSYLLFFLEKRVKYISICEAGYAGCHELVASDFGDLELIDHNSDVCVECTGKWKPSLMASVRGGLKGFMQAVDKGRKKFGVVRRSGVAIGAVGGDGDVVGGGGTGGGGVVEVRKRQRGYFMYEKVEMGNYMDEKEVMKGANFHLCKNDPLLMIYLSNLRDKETEIENFRICTQQLLTCMLQQILTYHFVERPLQKKRKLHGDRSHGGSGSASGSIDVDGEGTENSESTLDGVVDSGSGFGTASLAGSMTWPLQLRKYERVGSLETSFGSLIATRGIYGVALNDSSEHALKAMLMPLYPVVRSVVGTLKVEESFTQDQDGVIRTNRQAIALMPKDIQSRVVIVFAPAVVHNELHSAVDALLKLGAVHENMIVLALTASRNAVVGLLERYKRLQVWVAAVDALEGGRLSPGIGSFKHRYKYVNSDKSGAASSSGSRKKKKRKGKKGRKTSRKASTDGDPDDSQGTQGTGSSAAVREGEKDDGVGGKSVASASKSDASGASDNSDANDVVPATADDPLSGSG